MDLLKILEMAIRLEVDAKALYVKGEQETASEDARSLFSFLAAEEEKHRLLLLDLYQKTAGREYAESEW